MKKIAEPMMPDISDLVKNFKIEILKTVLNMVEKHKELQLNLCTDKEDHLLWHENIGYLRAQEDICKSIESLILGGDVGGRQDVEDAD